MFRKMILGFVLMLGLSVQAQTKKAPSSYETKVKNYLTWFESLPDHKKREAAKALVLVLNRMSPHERGIWLATAEKYGKKKVIPEVKEVLVDSLTNEGVKEKLFKDFVKSTDEKIDTIIILSSSIAKDRTVAVNTEIRKKIADWKVVIADVKRKRDSIDKIPIAPNDYEKQKARDSIVYPLVYKEEEGERALPRLGSEIIVYDETNFEERTKWNSYLINEYEIEVWTLRPHRLTDEELDSGKSSGVKFDRWKTIYFARFDIGHRNGYRWDEYSRFEFEQIEESVKD